MSLWKARGSRCCHPWAEDSEGLRDKEVFELPTLRPWKPGAFGRDPSVLPVSLASEVREEGRCKVSHERHWTLGAEHSHGLEGRVWVRVLHGPPDLQSCSWRQAQCALQLQKWMFRCRMT